MGDPFQGGIRFEIPAENKAGHCRGCFTGRTEKVENPMFWFFFGPVARIILG
jgi:hypothetical protein